MKRRWYRVLWVFEVMIIVVVALLLTIPTQDFVRREFEEWHRHPSADTLRAVREKQHEEYQLRLSRAGALAAVALLLAFPLIRLRPKPRESN